MSHLNNAFLTNDLNAWWRAIFRNQGQAWLTMHSGSMYPLMPIGSQILVKYFEHQSIRVGDIVLYLKQNQFIAHRVLKINTAKNQCLESGDNTFATSVISMDNIIGVVKKIKLNHKELDLSSRAGIWLTWFITVTSLGVIAIIRKWSPAGYLLHRLRVRLIRTVVALSRIL